MLKLRIDFNDSQIFLTETTIYEARKLGIGPEQIQKFIKYYFSNNVKIYKISNDMHSLAEFLLRTNNPLLHRPDNENLAFAMCTSSILLTCDKNLAKVAKISEVQCINPDTIVCEETKKPIKKKWRKIVNISIIKTTNADIRKTVLPYHKISSLYKRPITKIVWRSFTE